MSEASPVPSPVLQRWGRLSIGIAVGLSALVGLLIWVGTAAFLHDDTFIMLRYARNFANGHGLVWNLGEPVEGYTSFLHTLLTAGLGGLGLDWVTAARTVTGVSFLGLLVFLAWRATRRGPSWWWATGATMACAPLIAWIHGGLEAPLVASLATIGVWLGADALDALEGDNARPVGRAALATAVLVAATLARPDCVLFVVLLGGFGLITELRARPGLPLASLAALATAALIVGPWLIWKFDFYGSILPNTYYAKVSGVGTDRLSLGLDYLWGFVSAPPFVLPLLVVVVLWRWPTWSRRPGLAFAVACALVYPAWTTWSGGDHMEALRLFVPAMPLAWTVIAALTDEVRFTPALKIGVSASLVLLLVGQLSVDRINPHRMNEGAFLGTVVGTWLDENVPEDAVIALHVAGATPFYADGRTYIDMLGLNDAHIARRDVTEVRAPGQLMPGHAKGDGAYVLSRKPDIIIVGGAQGVPIDAPVWLSDVELGESAEFHEHYVLRRVVIDMRERHPHYEAFERLRPGFLEFLYYERQESQ